MKILLSHGGGGSQGRDLIKTLFARRFSNAFLDEMGDSAMLNILPERIAFATDAFVVDPLIFPGGDIGKLAICGTVNDLAVAGARPLYLSAAFIIEEGAELDLLEKIVDSMAATALAADVKIVAGDTKVVEKGKCDKLFISTSGIGEIIARSPISPSNIQEGDRIIINGFIADHGMAIMAAREGLSIKTPVISDCAPLNKLIGSLLAKTPDVHFMRDATRGGLAAVLNEAVEGQNFGIEIEETRIPLREETSIICELLGIDPLGVANEGKLIAFVSNEHANLALSVLKTHPLGENSQIIGRVTSHNPERVSLITALGTRRILSMPSGEQLPRIC